MRNECARCMDEESGTERKAVVRGLTSLANELGF